MNQQSAMMLSGSREIEISRITEYADRAARGFHGLGIGENDCVAVILRNDFAFFIVAKAAERLGAYVVPINWHYTGEEAGYILRDCNARALVIHADLLPQVADGLPAVLPMFVVPTAAEIAGAYGIEKKLCKAPKGLVDFRKWLGRFEAWDQPAKPVRNNMIYTSGTTGQPKGVRRNPVTVEEQRLGAELRKLTFGLEPEREIRTVVTGPVYHSAPNGYALLCLRYDAIIVLQPRFDAEELLQLIEQHRITHIHMVPTMFVRLLRLPDEIKQKHDLSSLEFVVHAAAPCPPEVKRRMIEWWGPVINEYYGGTESGPICFHDSAEALKKPGAAGRPVWLATVKVLDPEGNKLPTGEVGEIYSKLNSYPDFTYNGNPEGRSEVERDGLITLGDMGYFDDDGYLFVSDRVKDMVISGGVNIYPAEIESVLITMKGVKDCAVFGIPDEEFGEALCAVIEPDPRWDIDADQVMAWLRVRMAGYKVPRHIEFRDNLPREDSGKIFKRKLRESYWQGRDRRI